MNMRIARSRRVLGGTLLGLVVGVLLGLAVALGVAIYVTKVPVPFVDRGLATKPGQDAAEAERNKGWNPNAHLGGGPAPPPEAGGAPAVAAPKAPPAAGRDPIAELLESRMGQERDGAPTAVTPPADPFIYFVQAGAFRNLQEAESQRARVAMLGMAAEITEREQGGRTVFRVRVGPFSQREVADATREQLEVNGVEAALVRVQR